MDLKELHWPFVGLGDEEETNLFRSGFKVPNQAAAIEICNTFWGPYLSQTGRLRVLTQEEAFAMTPEEADRVGDKIVEAMKFVANDKSDPTGKRHPVTFVFSFQGEECDARIMTWDRKNNPPSFGKDYPSDFDGSWSSSQWAAVIALWARHFGFGTAYELGLQLDTAEPEHYHALNLYRSFRPHTAHRWGSLNYFQAYEKG